MQNIADLDDDGLNRQYLVGNILKYIEKIFFSTNIEEMSSKKQKFKSSIWVTIILDTAINLNENIIKKIFLNFVNYNVDLLISYFILKFPLILKLKEVTDLTSKIK